MPFEEFYTRWDAERFARKMKKRGYKVRIVRRPKLGFTHFNEYVVFYEPL